MKIRNKILFYFSTTVITLTVISSVIIYILFYEHREEEFQQKQKEKIIYTVGLVTEYRELSQNLSAIMDRLTIHDFYDEKMLVFNASKQLIYKSVDDLAIYSYEQLLNQLSPAKQWIETKEDEYDIVAVYIENDGNDFYAISKAYDEAGYVKLIFLRNVLIVITIFISVTVLFITIYLSKHISQPITNFAENLGVYDLSEGKVSAIDVPVSSYELSYLAQKFNQLAKRTNEAFSFQKHAIQHISHELKTPLTALLSELEKAAATNDPGQKNNIINNQIIKVKSLGEIINILLEISKIEAGQHFQKEPVRLDEMVFDLIREWSVIQPAFQFEINFKPEVFNQDRLLLYANKILIKQAFSNLMHNCIKYSFNATANILLDCTNAEKIKISFTNQGKQLQDDEKQQLFNLFFRGNNNKGISGSGLGLILTKKIIELHNGEIAYNTSGNDLNTFTINFPLS